MPVFDIYSRRKKRSAQAEPDVYQFSDASQALRQQICYILERALGPYHLGPYSGKNEHWNFIRDAVCREKGLPHLFSRNADADEDCYNAIKNWPHIDDWLTIVELSFRVISWLSEASQHQREKYGIVQDSDDAINELNFRLREAGLGYQFENDQIVRVDAQLIHAEVVKPALSLLADPRFEGAQEEFLKAHAHYRAGEHADAVVDANSAFESTMKAICDIKGWQYPKGARASDLVKMVRKNGLLPSYLDNSFDSL